MTVARITEVQVSNGPSVIVRSAEQLTYERGSARYIAAVTVETSSKIRLDRDGVAELIDALTTCLTAAQEQCPS